MLMPGVLDLEQEPGTDWPVLLLRSDPCGKITSVQRAGDEIVASGRTTLPPGEYTCGVDLCDIKWTDDDGLLLFTEARLIGLTVYPHDSETKPAWPDAKIVVSE